MSEGAPTAPEPRPTPSPRTETEPMAFTAGEFSRGTLAAWLWFNTLFAGAVSGVQIWSASTSEWGSWSGLGFVFLYFVPVALVVSGIVTLSCCAAAWWLGRLLRRRSSIVLHAVFFAVLGWVVAAVVISGYLLAVRAPFSLGDWMPLLIQGCSAAGVAFGWGTTVRHSIRVEAGRRRRPRVDPDAAHEDAL